MDTSPQGDEEDRGFELSDTDSLSDDGNLSGNLEHTNNCQHLTSRRGIVNPNYPGFQHLAHTLDYTIKTHASDTDLTDDDLDIDLLPPSTTINNVIVSKLNIDVNNINNNINNNNNNNEEVLTEGPGPENVQEIADVEFKIDSVNRLDSVENISKVFYDKPKFNIPLDDAELNIQIDENVASGVQKVLEKESNQISSSISIDNIIGDFGKEIEQAIEHLSLSLEKSVEPLQQHAEEPVKLINLKGKTVLREKTIEVRESIVKMETIVPTIETVAIIKPFHVETIKSKMADAFLSDQRDDIITNTADIKMKDVEEIDSNKISSPEKVLEKKDCEAVVAEVVSVEKFCKEELADKEKDDSDVVPKKKEKLEVIVPKKELGMGVVQRREYTGRNRSELMANRRSAPPSTVASSHRSTAEKKRTSPDLGE